MELRRVDRAQTPYMTSIDHLLNLSPPISLRYISPDTKKPLVKNPSAINPIALVIQLIGYSPRARKEVKRTPRALVLSDRQIGQTTCPAPEATRNRTDTSDGSRAILVVRIASGSTTPAMMRRRLFWQLLLSPTNSRALLMESCVLMVWTGLCIYMGDMPKLILILIVNMAEEFNEEEEMIINQEYKIWKKESPDYYDFLLLHSLGWPSFTFQWLPEQQTHENHTSFHALIASSNADPEHSQILKIKIDYPSDNKTEPYFQQKASKITIEDKISHNGQINRVRYCPANPQVAAVASTKGEITLTTMKESVGKLVAHSAEGYGLSWNTVNKQLLLSGFSDKKICIWDIEQNRQENGKYVPIFQILHHSAPIEDVAWHKFHPSLFASCSDDRLISIWDTRFRHAGPNDDKKPLFEVVAHTDQVYSLDFSPFNQFLFASGSADENVSVWDMRNLTRALSTLPTQKNAVIKVQWSPFSSSILASCGYGRNVDIWDLTKQKKENDNPYLFRHMGHRSKVVDFDWHPTQKLVLGSVEESNCLQIWQVNRALYYEEEESK